MPSNVATRLALLLVFWIPPIFWVALAVSPLTPAKPVAVTNNRLDGLAKSMKTYLASHDRAPPTLNTLRAWAHVEHIPFSAYDGFGNRFDYLRLDERHYLLRSFGADAEQNTLGGAPDIGLVSWGKRPPLAVRYKLEPKPAPGFFPAVLLEGADSPDGVSYARLFVDAETASRHLVVRLKDQSDLFMVAPHDRVEEFLWLPSSNKILFTASGSSRHRDGVFLWDLDNDSCQNLVDLAIGALPMSPSAKAQGYWLSLAGLSTEGPTVYVYAAPRHDGTLDPALFFAPANVAAFNLGDGKKPPRYLGAEAIKNLPALMPFMRPLDLTRGVDTKGGLQPQVNWLKLPATGDLEKALLEWHHFIETNQESPLLPYGLWILSSIYGESFELLAKKGAKDAEVLRTFGTEVSRALLTEELAPTYLKGLALFAHESLMDGLPLPYKMTGLSPPEVVEPMPPPTDVRIPGHMPRPVSPKGAQKPAAKNSGEKN